MKNFVEDVILLQTVLSSIAITQPGLTNEINHFRWAVPDPTLNMPNYHIDTEFYQWFKGSFKIQIKHFRIGVRIWTAVMIR